MDPERVSFANQGPSTLVLGASQRFVSTYLSRVQPTRESNDPLSCYLGNACGGPAPSCARFS